MGVLLNPRMPLEEQEKIREALLALSLENHYWFGTSGTTGSSKWIALSNDAIFCSAEAVNRHLQSDRHDIWLHALPLFHVGGMGICARSFLSGATVSYVEGRWDPQLFYARAHEARATLTALVPTQLYDLVQRGLLAPPSLRATIIGGAALSPELYQRAYELGWMPLASYGMTECASQVATAKVDSYPSMRCLDHVEVRVNDKGCISIRSQALFTMQAHFDGDKMRLITQEKGAWYDTQDVGEVTGNELVMKGRSGDVVKVSGECVDMYQLNMVLDALRLQFPCDAALYACEDARLGNVVALAVALGPSPQIDALVESFNAMVLPFERIRHVQSVDEIPRTSLGKVVTSRLQTPLLRHPAAESP